MVRRALAAVLGELALAMVGVAPESDAPAAPSAAGNNAGNTSGSSPSSPPAFDSAIPPETATSSSPAAADDPAPPAPPPPVVEETPEVAEARAQAVATLLPLYNALAHEDEQESVRIIALEATVPIARALGAQLAEEHLLPSLQKVSSFKSWRARCLLAKKITQLQVVLGPKVTRNCLLVRLPY